MKMLKMNIIIMSMNLLLTSLSASNQDEVECGSSPTCCECCLSKHLKIQEASVSQLSIEDPLLEDIVLFVNNIEQQKTRFQIVGLEAQNREIRKLKDQNITPKRETVESFFKNASETAAFQTESLSKDQKRQRQKVHDNLKPHGLIFQDLQDRNHNAPSGSSTEGSQSLKSQMATIDSKTSESKERSKKQFSRSSNKKFRRGEPLIHKKKTKS